MYDSFAIIMEINECEFSPGVTTNDNKPKNTNASYTTKQITNLVCTYQ